MGITSSCSRKPVLLDIIGGHFADEAVEAIKQNKTLRGTGDNWDMKVLRGHMTKDVQNDDLHMFASNLYVNRLTFLHLQNTTPKRNLSTCPNEVFTMSVADLKVLKENFKVLIGRVCLEFLPKFKFLKRVVPAHILHPNSKEMSEKSTIISLPIINANECSYNDCVKILRKYEHWIFDIYKRAGFIHQRPEPNNPPILQTEAAADQPGAHMIETEDDPMREMKIPFSGDQLTRVRFAGAKDLLAGAHTPSDRFEHCSPFQPVMWHTKASLLQYSYSLLYNSESVHEVGTLKYFRERYNRKNVTPSKVLDCYDGCEDFFLNIGKSYIVVALLKFFGMDSLDSYPTENTFNVNMVHKPTDEVLEYYNQAIDKFVNEYIFQVNQAAPVGQEEDCLKNYGLCIIFLTITILQLKDTAAEADGIRNLVNQKHIMAIFKSINYYSKYAIEMFVSIAQMECMLTERLSEQFKWSFFCNWHGGIGRNIENDVAQEICNSISKNAVKRMGANKTLNSISKVCQAVSGIKIISDNFDENLLIHKTSTRHTTRSFKKDEVSMIEELITLNLFEYHCNRQLGSFPDIRRSPLLYLDFREFQNWIQKHKTQMASER